MKKVFTLILALAMVFALCACGKTAPAAAPVAEAPVAEAPVAEAPAAEPLTLKVACAETEDSIYGVTLTEAFAEITEKTEGRLQFELYASNQLGSIPDMLEQMRSGAPMIVSMGFDNLGDLVPDFAPASFPYIYNNLYEVSALGKSEWIEGIKTQLGELNIVPLCFGAQGYRHFVSSFPIESAADIADHIVRMGPSGAAQGFIEVMGGTPTTTTWADNYSLIQTKTIEACEAPLSLLLSSSLNEVCDYLSLTGHFVNPLSLCINNDFWNQISAEDQAIVLSVLDEHMVKMADTAMEMEDGFVQQFKDLGVTVIEPDKDSFSAFVPALFEKLGVDPSIYDDIRAAIDSNK